MNFFVHPQGICESTSVGDATRVWAFAHVLPGAKIGRDCNICDHVFIENDVVIGDRVTIKCGVQLWDGTRVEDDVFIGPNATFTNDKMPRSKQYQETLPQTRIAHGASIGANATILPGLTIHSLAMVGAGCVVTKDVPPRAIVTGNPGRITGYVDAARRPIDELRTGNTAESALLRTVPLESGAVLQTLKSVVDLRGLLSVGQFGDEIPFVPKRYFLVYDVPSKYVRGEHAHCACHQFLVCVKGAIAVMVYNGRSREEFLLDRPTIGIYVPPKVWCVQYNYSADAVLMAFASHEYDPADYVRDYDEFLNLVSADHS